MKVVTYKSKKDIIEILPDDHKFSKREIEIYNIYDMSKEEVEKIKAKIIDHKSKNTKVPNKVLSVESCTKVKQTYDEGKLTWQIE
jgi:hypothetical protein